MVNHKRLIQTILLAAAAVTLHCCKTSEENYKKAYQAAIEKQNEGYTEEEILNMAREEAIPRAVFNGDSIPMKGAYVNSVKLDPPVAAASRYNVIVATFKQKFNAMSVLDRLRDSGYDDGRLLIDRDQTYYVAASTTDTLARAVETLRQLQKSSPVAMKSPCPYILRRP
jgi:hypothetical protein